MRRGDPKAGVCLWGPPGANGEDAIMSWAKLDDQFADHPKIVTAGPLAAWLYVAGLTYCCRYLTDGRIPEAAVPRLANFGGLARLGPDGWQPVDVGELVAALVENQLWEPCEGGYLIHDYLDYNPPAEKVLRERKNGHKRMAEWREKRQSKKNGPEARYGECYAHVTDVPSPSPSPDAASTDVEAAGPQAEAAPTAPAPTQRRPGARLRSGTRTSITPGSCCTNRSPTLRLTLPSGAVIVEQVVDTERWADVRARLGYAGQQEDEHCRYARLVPGWHPPILSEQSRAWNQSKKQMLRTLAGQERSGTITRPTTTERPSPVYEPGCVPAVGRRGPASTKGTGSLSRTSSGGLSKGATRACGASRRTPQIVKNTLAAYGLDQGRRANMTLESYIPLTANEAEAKLGAERVVARWAEGCGRSVWLWSPLHEPPQLRRFGDRVLPVSGCGCGKTHLSIGMAE